MIFGAVCAGRASITMYGRNNDFTYSPAIKKEAVSGFCRASIDGMGYGEIFGVPQIGIVAQILFYGIPGQRVAPVVFRVVAVAFYLLKGDMMALFTDGQKQQPPQILVFHGFSVSGFPAALLPIVDPVIVKSVDQVS